jgi:hypothetical protein
LGRYRWAAEPTFSWQQRARRLRVRDERRDDIYQAVVHIENALLCWGRIRDISVRHYRLGHMHTKIYEIDSLRACVSLPSQDNCSGYAMDWYADWKRFWHGAEL